MKKRGIEILLFVFLISGIFAPLVSAQVRGGDFFYTAQNSVRPVIDSVLGLLNPFLEAIIGDYSTNEFFFTKVLLLILLFAIISTILTKVPRLEDNLPVAYIVSFIVSIFAVRFMSENQFILGILLPYGTLGIAITIIIPFIVFFYFVHSTGMTSGTRKLAWGLFAIVFFVLWNSRYNELSKLANKIYGWSLVMVIGILLFDKAIHRYFVDVETNKFVKKANEALAARWQAEYQEIIDVQSHEAEHRRKAIRKQLKKLGAQV